MRRDLGFPVYFFLYIKSWFNLQININLIPLEDISRGEKGKKEYYGSLEFSDKSKSRRTIKNIKIESNHKKTADIFINYFANVVTSLEIPEFDTIDQLSETIFQPTLKAIVKYRKHPSITAINQAFPKRYLA